MVVVSDVTASENVAVHDPTPGEKGRGMINPLSTLRNRG